MPILQQQVPASELRLADVGPGKEDPAMSDHTKPVYQHTPCSMATIAWTGGSHPQPYEQCHPMERKLVDSLFQAQYDSFCAYWSKAPDGATIELYRTRARYDAHATVRAGLQLQVDLHGG